MKKYLNWDAMSVIILLVGCTVACIALAHYSYAWTDGYPVWLQYAMRIVGVIGTIGYPVILVSFFLGEEHYTAMQELQDSYNALIMGVNRIPDDEEYKMEEGEDYKIEEGE